MIKRYNKNNLLPYERYHISEDLQNIIESEQLNVNGQIYDDNFYLIVFRVLNTKKLDVVYNYISYNTLFFEPLLAFLLARNDTLDLNREPGYFLSVVDDNLPISKESLESPLYFSWNSPNLNGVLANLDAQISTTKPLHEVLNIISRLVYTAKQDIMYNIFENTVHRRYMPFIENIIGTLPRYPYLLCKDFRYQEPSQHSLIKSCVFIVKDKDKFIKNISENDSFNNINTGPQKYRGQPNSASYFLSVLDKDFRENLYYHNWYHCNNNITHPYLNRLEKKKFSFNNIHMNLGGVRWYSANNSVKEKKLYKPNAENRLKSLDSDSEIYKRLDTFLSKSPVNNDTQIEIENYLFNSGYAFVESENDDVNYNLINKCLTEFFLSKKDILINIINNFKQLNLDSKKITRTNEKTKSRKYLSVLLKQVSNNAFISIIFGRLMRIITFYDKYNYNEYNKMLDIIHSILDHTIREYYYNLYLEAKETDTKLTLYQWKLNNSSITDILEDATLKTNIGGIIIDWMIESNLIQSKTIVIAKKERRNIVIPSDEILNIKGDSKKIMHLPVRIPMIVKPKQYTRETVDGQVIERLGGYLLNDIKTSDTLIIDKWNLKEPSEIENDNVVYNLVNNMSSVGYKINKDVLNFINTYGIEYGLVYDKIMKKSLQNKSNLTKEEYINLNSTLSKLELQENILGLANVFANIHEFFIPVRLDFRGRVNCMCEYLNYQSNELSKSLLLFSKPEKIKKTDIKAISYLKAYGANCFGNKLDKKSWNDRIKWIDNNLDNIINFTNGKLIKQAKNKLLFIAFCFEYNRLLSCLNNNDITYFETSLPIQLDATCNGYQHLSMLSSDNELAKELNLCESTWNDIPKDLYNYISINLKTYFKEQLESAELTDDLKTSYSRLSKIDFHRSIFKKPIMTSAYNATPIKIMEYIEEYFTECSENESRDPDKWYQYKEDSSIKIRFSDFSVITRGLKKVLDQNFTGLKYLLKYLNDVARICTTLNLSIPWTSPSGVTVIQGYLASKEIRLLPFTYTKKSLTLRVPDREEGKLYKRKQIRSFMPNLVHSLDAASLALLLDSYFNNCYKVNNIYTVHDCFAVTANNIDSLMLLLKLVYRKIYSRDSYIIKLDRGIKDHIKNHYGDKSLDEKTLIINIQDNKPMQFPNVKEVLGTKLSTNFLSSSYIIN